MARAGPRATGVEYLVGPSGLQPGRSIIGRGVRTHIQLVSHVYFVMTYLLHSRDLDAHYFSLLRVFRKTSAAQQLDTVPRHERCCTSNVDFTVVLLLLNDNTYRGSAILQPSYLTHVCVNHFKSMYENARDVQRHIRRCCGCSSSHASLVPVS